MLSDPALYVGRANSKFLGLLDSSSLVRAFSEIPTCSTSVYLVGTVAGGLLVN